METSINQTAFSPLDAFFRLAALNYHLTATTVIVLEGRDSEETGPMAKMNLKSLSAYDLIDLRKRIDAVLSAKVATERKALEASLQRLEGAAGKAGRRSVLAGKKVAPKYRGPGGETWTGRGLKPKWLTAALADGKKIEDFLIAKSGSRKGRKAKG
jgi:DNA-binding protein H-NS